MFFHHLHHLSTTSPKIKENQLTNHAQQHAVSSSFLHKPIASQLRVHLTPAVADLLPCEFGWTNIYNAPLVDCLVVIPYSDGGVKVWWWHQFHLLNRMWTTEKPKIDLFRVGILKISGPIFGCCPIYMYKYIYIHTNNLPTGIDCRTSRSFRRFFRSVENRRPVSEGSVPPRGSIADLWGPPWQKKTKGWCTLLTNILPPGLIIIHKEKAPLGSI